MTEAVPMDRLLAVAAEAPQTNGHTPAQHNGHHTGNHCLDVARWLADRGVEFKVKSVGDRTIYSATCPNNHEHVGDFNITQFASGALSASCFHNGCSGMGWAEFRDAIGKPDAGHYDPPLSGDARRHKVENTAKKSSNVTVATVEHYKPFPVDMLPKPLRGFVTEGAMAIGCDPSFIAVPSLVAAAAAIGNSRRIRLKGGWSEPSIIWAAIIAQSGGHKSPAVELSLRPLRDLQRRKLREFDRLHREYLEVLLPRYEREVASWKKNKTGGEPPQKPTEPVAWRILVDDVTIEAFAGLLLKQPRGLLLACDELAAWFGAFERYKGGGKASDAAKWLEVHGGRMLLVDRKHGFPPTLCIPNAAGSVIGGIQPETFRRCLTPEHRASGMMARIITTCPPRKAKRWSESEVSDETQRDIEAMYDRLLTLQMEEVEDDDPRPMLMGLEFDAKQAFIAFYNEHAEEQSGMADELSATWSKLEAYAPRLAMVHYLIRWANGEIRPEHAMTVDGISMEAGIVLAQWFGHEAKRVHAMFSETPDQRDQRELVEWIELRGGKVTVRDLQRGPRRFRNAPQLAEACLTELVSQNLGTWNVVQTGGKPATEFQLLEWRRRHNPELQAENDTNVATETRKNRDGTDDDA